MKKIIKWLKSELPSGLCVAMGKGKRCVVCWPWTILVFIGIPLGIWLTR